MTYPLTHIPGSRSVLKFARDEDGTSLVEFGLVLAIFLLMIFGLIDFGRMAFHYVTAEKAMHIAARVAAVRPPACAGVPEFHVRDASNTGSTAPQYGTRCNAGSNICSAAVSVSCSGDLNNATVAEIWPAIQGAMPIDATPANLLFRYDYDSDLGFLGGPYVPVVTVELQNLTFRFVSPLGALAGLAGATSVSSLGSDVVFPAMSVSLPGEDLAQGVQG